MTKALVAALLSLVATTAQAKGADPIVLRECWATRNYCGFYGPPYRQDCASPYVGVYCEETHLSGVLVWYWL